MCAEWKKTIAKGRTILVRYQPLGKWRNLIMEQNEKSSLLGKAMDVGERLVGVRDEASRLKTAASQAIEDAVTGAKRFTKRSRYAAEDLLEDAGHRVKQDPLRSVALGFAVGLAMGALAVWLATHNARE
jgi:ElaB/YqjD/DUF883 family membrane-anchored ribosome-binding protein